MDRLVAARRWDVYRDAFADQAALETYLEDTGAGLMWLAGRAVGAAPGPRPRCAGWAGRRGWRSFLRAVPELEARGRVPLPDAGEEAVAVLAQAGLARIASGRQGIRAAQGGARWATLAAWQAGTAAALGPAGAGAGCAGPVAAIGTWQTLGSFAGEAARDRLGG